MTNPPGEGTPPERPDEPRPGDQPPEQPGYWEQQAQQQGPQPWERQPWEQQQQQQQQWPGYPAPGYGAPGQYAPDHPRATTALVLGILGLVLCQVIAPFAWVIGKRTVDEIDASQGTIGGRGPAQAGYVLGVVGTVILGLGVLAVVAWFVFAAVVFTGNFR